MVEPLTFTYTNWRGETSERRAMPIDLQFGSTKWHPEPQWLLVANDLDKGETRMFAIKDMRFPSAPDMRAVCDALGFDPTNHHNAAKCPYCNPQGLAFSPSPAMVETTATTDVELVKLIREAFDGNDWIAKNHALRKANDRIVALSAEVERLGPWHQKAHDFLRELQDVREGKAAAERQRDEWARTASREVARSVEIERQRDDLKAALEPFAAFLEAFEHLTGPSGYRDETVLSVASHIAGEREITGLHLKAARAALSRLPSEPVPSPSGEEERKALEEARKGFDMIHRGLMDPTRPRQSVGEVAATFLARTDAALSRLQEPR